MKHIGKIAIRFAPTVYEHCAALMGKSPSQTARSEDLLVEGQLRSYELYRHSLISAGLDIYNIEPEALGGKITYYDRTRRCLQQPCPLALNWR